MFQIDLYNCASPPNVVNKDISIRYDSPMGTLRSGSSIIDPIIVIHTDASPGWRKGFNYAYIEEFGRYYYVTNIIAVNGVLPSENYPSPTQLWEIHMHVDVLMSFKDEILRQTAIVARQENRYNLMLDDGFFMSYQNPKFQTKLFSVPDPFEQQEFVLIVAGS